MFTYLICSTPRVGSNLLCGLLHQTAVVGRPREYLCPHNFRAHGPTLVGLEAARTADDLHRYLDAAAREFGAEGRFGIKTHLHQLRAALELGLDFDARFPERFVHMTRGDVVAQSISTVKAAQTGAWTAQERVRGALEFDPEAIRDNVRRARMENQAWEALFDAYDVEPYRLTYEGLCADFEGELAGVLDFLGVDVRTVEVAGAVERATGYFTRQRDDVSATWRARYRDWLRERATAQRAGHQAALR